QISNLRFRLRINIMVILKLVKLWLRLSDRRKFSLTTDANVRLMHHVRNYLKPVRLNKVMLGLVRLDLFRFAS
ncbi:hypothetical protein L9F63_001522, partial [Diploptera punctata]